MSTGKWHLGINGNKEFEKQDRKYTPIAHGYDTYLGAPYTNAPMCAMDADGVSDKYRSVLTSIMSTPYPSCHCRAPHVIPGCGNQLTVCCWSCAALVRPIVSWQRTTLLCRRVPAMVGSRRRISLWLGRRIGRARTHHHALREFVGRYRFVVFVMVSLAPPHRCRYTWKTSPTCVCACVRVCVCTRAKVVLQNKTHFPIAHHPSSRRPLRGMPSTFWSVHPPIRPR